MRPDMAKVLVERPRFPGESPRRVRLAGAADELPHREGMRRQHTLSRAEKGFSDHFGPLRRFLASRVGRPWNKVHAEVCVHARADSTVQQHLRRHLHDFVTRAVTMSADGPFATGHGYPLHPGSFYVHPRSGLLCVVRPRRRG